MQAPWGAVTVPYAVSEDQIMPASTMWAIHRRQRMVILMS